MNDPNDEDDPNDVIDTIEDLSDEIDNDQLQQFDEPIAVYKRLNLSGNISSEIYPIETAPTDGTTIFVANHEMLAKVHWYPAITKDDNGNVIDAWKNDVFGFAWIHDEEHGPTHWWPLAFMIEPSNFIN